MRHALQLARRGRFLASPNPRVGCVIAQRTQDSAQPYRIIGEGWHRACGAPHAEPDAIANCTEDPAGAELFVTLEPCNHHGRTPPCTEAIIKAGIARVVAATADPFPDMRGKSFERLRQAGIEVTTGVLEDEARHENRFFIHSIERGLPWVILKAAATLDGKCSTATGESKWITSDDARAYAHEWRAEVDAIVCGVKTVIADDPSLNARPESLNDDEFRQPLRVILDPLLKTPLDARVIQSANESPVWLLCRDDAPEDAMKAFQDSGARIEPLPHEDGRFNLRSALERLAGDSIQSVWLEGGPRIHTAFLDDGLVNEVHVYIAPALLGGSESPSFYMGRGAATMKEIKRLERVQWRLFERDALAMGVLRRQLP